MLEVIQEARESVGRHSAESLGDSAFARQGLNGTDLFPPTSELNRLSIKSFDAFPGFAVAYYGFGLHSEVVKTWRKMN